MDNFVCSCESWAFNCQALPGRCCLSSSNFSELIVFQCLLKVGSRLSVQCCLVIFLKKYHFQQCMTVFSKSVWISKFRHLHQSLNVTKLMLLVAGLFIYPQVSILSQFEILPSFHHMLALIIFGLKCSKFFTQRDCVILDQGGWTHSISRAALIVDYRWRAVNNNRLFPKITTRVSKFCSRGWRLLVRYYIKW